MNLISRIGRLALIGTLLAGFTTPALAAGDAANNMIKNGVTSRADLASKLKASPSLAREYAIYGITPANVMSDDTVNGQVTAGGRVIITQNGTDKTVATDAMSYGRQNIPGSTKVGSLYRRPTSVSFKESKLPALVHMHNGSFVYAVIKSCGNIVTAKPVAKAAPQQKTTSSKPVTPPASAIPTTIIVNQTQTQVQEQAQIQMQAETPTEQSAQVASTIPTPAPVPQTQAQTQAQPATPTLPETGPAAPGIAGLSMLMTTGWYWRRSKRNLLLALHKS